MAKMKELLADIVGRTKEKKDAKQPKRMVEDAMDSGADMVQAGKAGMRDMGQAAMRAGRSLVGAETPLSDLADDAEDEVNDFLYGKGRDLKKAASRTMEDAGDVIDATVESGAIDSLKNQVTQAQELLDSIVTENLPEAEELGTMLDSVLGKLKAAATAAKTKAGSMMEK